MESKIAGTITRVSVLINSTTEPNVKEAAQAALSLYSALRQTDDNQQSWCFLVNQSQNIIRDLIHRQSTMPAFCQRVARIAELHQEIERYYLCCIYPLVKIEHLFAGPNIRKKIGHFCKELDAHWQGVLSLFSVKNQRLNGGAILQASNDDNLHDVARLAHIGDLVRANSDSAFVELGLHPYAEPDWAIRRSAAALITMLGDPVSFGEHAELVIRPLLRMLQDHFEAARSVRSERWRIHPTSVTDWSSKPITEGAAGRVFEAKFLGSDVIVQMLHSGLSETNMVQFRREISRWHSLAHPNLLCLLGACDTVPTPFMVSPAVATTLGQQFLTASNAKSMETKLQLMHGVALGMAHLHSNGVVHGNLRSDAILLGFVGNPIVADFGISALRQTSGPSIGQVPERTFEYLAPELVGKGSPFEPSIKGDVYAYGITFYELLSNGIIWTDASGRPLDRASLEYALRQGKRPKRIRGVVDEIWGLVEQCWQQNPMLRPSFAEIVGRLDPFVVAYAKY